MVIVLQWPLLYCQNSTCPKESCENIMLNAHDAQMCITKTGSVVHTANRWQVCVTTRTQCPTYILLLLLLLLVLHPFNGFFSKTTRVSRHQKGKPFWILLLLLLLVLHPFNDLFSQDIMGKPAPERYGKPFWNLLEQQMMGWQWHQLHHMHTICTSLQTDNHNSTSPLSFYRPDALPTAQPTASKHWRHI